MLFRSEPPRLSDKEMTQVQEQIKRMSYGQAPDLDNVKDTPKVKGAVTAPVEKASGTVAVKRAAQKSAPRASVAKAAAAKASASQSPAAQRPGRPTKSAKAPVMTATAIEKAPQPSRTISKAASKAVFGTKRGSGTRSKASK